ncbi:Putative glycerophosphodiester phosphodiesterase [Echinococcus granulosus]|uniref:Glycerophosphodiester phosphodiesterase n=2 Tax=Echinococcus granulosus TaxID=6210 RepID=W6UDF3_ECHGR|nr:Putative glycerophosphodiester phosphodiesterase [Echinococcus granulosus]EUB59355.1 Putative glycerophosphodiester phosphodiesterase [Echinococcus granulosus]
MQKRDHNQTIPFSVLVDTKALEEICVYLCNADTSSSSRYFVGIVGSSPQFGNWNPIEGLRCRFEAQKAPGFAYFSVTIVCRRCDVWTCAVPKSKLLLNLQYRFYVAEWRIDIESDPVEKKLVVLAWESRLKPRVFDLADNGTYIQRGYLMSHSELRIRLSGLALKLSKNAIPGLSSSTRDLTKLAGRRVYVTCRQSIVEENGLITALEGETPIYPNKNISTQPIAKNSSHMVYSLEQSLATEIRSQLIESSSSVPAEHTPYTVSQSLYIRGTPNSAFSIPPSRRPEFSVSPLSSRSSTCPSTPRSVSPALSQAGEPPVFLSVLSKERCTRRLGEHTGCWGTLYSSGDDVTFYIETDNAEDVAVELEFYVEVPRECENVEEKKLPPVKFLGSAFFGPFSGYWGQKRSQLLSRRRTPMGDVRISFIVINPILDGPSPTLDVSYKHYWKNRGTLEIGHRGMGTYYLTKKEKDVELPAPVKENTLRSFQAAVDHGADFVEMDVQLTKDHQVVVYHDFETVITPRKKRRGELQNLSVAVKDLPYAALRELRLQHASVLSEPQSKEDLDGEDLDPVELQDFPLLRDCLQHIDPDVGFDIEIKYPMDLKVGGSEMDNFFERNLYVDTILREIFKYAGNRRILLSCFDPDTCAMLQVKQIRFPVFQLGFWPDYSDIRQQSFEILCYSAKANELLGVAVNSDELLRNPDMAEFARDLGLIVLVWGSAANDSRNMKRLKELGVRGLIYDRIQEHRQIGSISLLKSGKTSSNSLSDSQQQQDLTPPPLEKCAPADSTGHSTPSPPPLESLNDSHESGTSTPSHQNHSHQNQAISANSASVDAQDLVDALNKQLRLNPTSIEKNKCKMPLTLNN